MIQSIIDGIVKAIRIEYNKSFRIYTESVEQGLQEPCFSVLCLNGIDEQKACSRHSRSYPSNITYFPVSEEPIAECLIVMERLYDLLKIIDIGSAKLRGIEMSGMVVDGVLQFQVTYSYFRLMENAETNMGELEAKTGRKE